MKVSASELLYLGAHMYRLDCFHSHISTLRFLTFVRIFFHPRVSHRSQTRYLLLSAESDHNTELHDTPARASTKPSVVLCDQQGASVQLKINGRPRNTGASTRANVFQNNLSKKRGLEKNKIWCVSPCHERELEKARLVWWMVCRCLFQPPRPPATSTHTRAHREVFNVALLCYFQRAS